MPKRAAFSASIRPPVRIIVMAAECGTDRINCWMPPTAAMLPILTSGRPKLALFEQRRMSQASAPYPLKLK
jgi:hypothetical protein